MKLNQLTFVVLATVGIVAGASAQVTIVHPRHRVRADSANMQGVSLVQQDLISAINSMKSALPIYDGMRVKSIGLAHRSLLLVDHALMGAQAPKRTKPLVFDTISSKTAHLSYNPTQIGSSQAEMQAGLQALNQASIDLQKAVNGNYGKTGVKLSGFIQQAITEASNALALHHSTRA